MITNFKIFESENFDQYKDKFFIYIGQFAKYHPILCYIVLVESIELYKHKYPINQYVKPNGDCFSVMKNGEIKDPAGWGMSLTKKEFEDSDFMTPEEFYQKHQELCGNLAFKVFEEYNGRVISQNDWYGKMLKHYKERLETIPDLRFYMDSKKYNL
jgi:hypothetical protein